MNAGTRLRTVLRVAVSLQTAICMTTAVVTNTNNKTLILVWAVFSIICDFVVAFITTYYNNDYTEIANEYTQDMRLAKKEELPDDFYEEEVNDNE